MPISTSLLLAMPLLAQLASPPDCSALLQQHLKTDLELPWQTFDQTEGQGFRVLAAAGCSREAGDLLEAWLAKRQREQRSVLWHLAQQRAEQDDRPAAIQAARQSLSADETAEAPLRWNDYVLATIAFLERDRTAFDRHRNAVAAAVERHAGNALNLKLLDRLGQHFELSYLGAQKATP